MRTSFLVTCALAFAALPLPAAAHDFWIEPSSFRPEPGRPVAARLLVGERFRGEPVPRNDKRVARFTLVGEAGESPMVGRPAADPAGAARVSAGGFQAIVYESHPSVVELERAKMETYVREEGLEPFFRGERREKVRDHFSRCAKALLLAGPPSPGATGFDRPLGLRLELVPEANPYALAKAASLPVRLLERGQPLRDVLVVAMSKARPSDAPLRARTDAEGRVRLPLSGAGVWLVKAVWIEPHESAPGEWRSWWASLTFEVPEPESHP